MVKRLTILLTIIAFLTTVGLGCKGLSSQEQAAVRPVTLEYWTVFDEVGAINKLAAQYQAARPYLTIKVRQFSADEIYDRLVEALSEDKGPDIISVSNHELKKYLGKIAPMPAAVKDTTITVNQGTFNKDTVISTASVSLPDKNQLNREYVQVVGKDVVINNQIYGLPLSLDVMALYYNKDLLDRSGVAEPPANWAEFQEAVKKITRYSGDGAITQSGAALGTGNNVAGFDDLLYVLFKQSGVEFTGGSGQAVFNAVAQNTRGATPAVSVMNFYTDFANSTRDTYSWNKEMGDSLERFARGAVGFFVGYSYHRPLIKARAPQLNFEVLPLLQLNSDRPVNAANYWIQTVTEKSKNPEIAWGFINFLARAQAQQYLSTTKRPTALRAFIKEQEKDAALSPFISQLLIADNWYRGRDYAAAKKALADLCAEWLNPPAKESDQSSYWQQALNRAASKINQTL